MYETLPILIREQITCLCNYNTQIAFGNQEKKMRAALYVRVSTQEQKEHGLSVDAQIKALTDFCKETGYRIVRIYDDAGFSARKSYKSRPALLELLADCEADKIDIVLFTKLDRWFRSVPDYYDVQKILDAHKVIWKAIWEDYSTETSADIFKVNIMLAVAQTEADRTSERIKSALDYKRARGDYVGKAPTGYKVRKGKLCKDSASSKAIESIFKTYLSTLSTSSTIKVAAEYGLLFDNSHILKLLRNPAYCGKCRNGCACEGYITEEQYNFIQNQLKMRSYSHPHTGRAYIFSSLIKCGYCGKSLSGSITRKTLVDGSISTHYIYKCTSKFQCPHIQITETRLEKYLLERLEDLIGKHNLSQEYDVSIQSDMDRGLKHKKALNRKLDRLKWLFSEGDISADEYKTKRDEIKSELSSINTDVPKPITLPDDWKEVYESLDIVHKKVFWRSILKSIVVTNETKGNPEINFR